MNRRDYDRMMRNMQQATPEALMRQQLQGSFGNIFGMGTYASTVHSTFASTTLDMGPPPPTKMDGTPNAEGQYTIPYEPPPPPTDGNEQILLFPHLFEPKADEQNFTFEHIESPQPLTRWECALLWAQRYLPFLFAEKQELESPDSNTQRNE